MIFHAHKADLCFDIAGKRYVVPRGANVDIPDDWAVLVKRRGLLLAEGPAAEAVNAAPVKPVAAKRRRRPMSKKEAAEAKANAKAMREELASLTASFDSDESEDED